MITKKLIERLLHSTSVTVLTGAGISAESGVPTFRGKDGLWENHDVQKLATPEAFQNNTQLFWKFYNWRRKLLNEIKPNLGHYALVDLEKQFETFTIITQNIDGLHQRAGSHSVFELHGNIKKTYCINCNYRNDSSDQNVLEYEDVPKCPECKGLMRPDVVLFGESLDNKILSKAQETSATSEVFFSIGTSSLVEPAASLPYVAKGNGAYLVEINLAYTPLSATADETLLGKSGKILPVMYLIYKKFK
jgi:NAD-dependent deacetylase